MILDPFKLLPRCVLAQHQAVFSFQSFSINVLPARFCRTRPPRGIATVQAVPAQGEERASNRIGINFEQIAGSRRLPLLFDQHELGGLRRLPGPPGRRALVGVRSAGRTAELTVRSNRNHGEDARDYSRNDLQAQAGDMHANPLGRLVGDWQQTAGQGPYGVRNRARRRGANGAVRAGRPAKQRGRGARLLVSPATLANSADPAPPAHSPPARPTTPVRHLKSLRPPLTLPAQELGYNPNDRHFLNDHTVPIYQTQTFLRRCILEGFQIGSFMTTLMSFNILVVVAIAAHIMKKSNPFHKEPPRAITEKDWEQRISGERFSSRAESVNSRPPLDNS